VTRHAPFVLRWVVFGFFAVAILLSELLAESGSRQLPGRTFALVVVLIWALLPAHRIKISAWPAWAPPVLFVVFSLGAYVVQWLGRDGLAGSLYQVVAVGPVIERDFFDSWLTLEGVRCYGEGVDVSQDNDCAFFNYGPVLLLLAPLGVSGALGTALGLAFMLGVAIGFLVLARLTNARGRFALSFMAVSGAVVLMTERGNFHSFLILVPALGIAAMKLLGGPSRLRNWAPLTALIAFAGVVVWYPFTQIAALIAALRLKRGWLLIASVAVVAGLYAWWGRDYLAVSAESQQWIGQFGFVAISASTFASSMLGLGQASAPVWAWGLVVAFAALAIAWGWVSAASGRTPNWQTVDPTDAKAANRVYVLVAALAGSAALFATAALSSGYQYRAAALVLCVPLLAASVAKTRAWRNNSATVLLVAASTVFFMNSPLAMTAGVLIASGFAAGVALCLVAATLVRRSERAPRS